jgi:hypothetical protein
MSEILRQVRQVRFKLLDASEKRLVSFVERPELCFLDGGAVSSGQPTKENGSGLIRTLLVALLMIS